MRVFGGVFHGVLEGFSIKDVDVEVVSFFLEVAVEHSAEVVDALVFVFAEGGRCD